MMKVELFSGSQSYLLTGGEQDSSVLAPAEALVGLCGQVSRSDVTLPGRPGVIPGVRTFAPIEADIPFYLHADDGDAMEKVYRDFRQMWRGGATFRIEGDHPLGAFYLDVSAGVLPGVDVDARRRTSVTVSVPVFNPVGLFRSGELSGENEVTVTNAGDVTVWPTIVTFGNAGRARCPSGAEFDIPAGVASVGMSPDSLTLDGAFPEGVEPGESATWGLPAGMRLYWSVLVADPWA